MLFLAIGIGVLVGVGTFTFQYAEGFSYFSKDPAACVNCHIMRPQYDSWQKASHHALATCADCHLPASGIQKWISKADNGYFHSKGFTLQDFKEPIEMRESNRRVLQDNCLRCHQELTHEITIGATSDPDALRCVHCHRDVGHGPRTGLGGPEFGETHD